MWVVGEEGAVGAQAHLGAGVHEDEVLAVQPQEAGCGQGQLTHSKHHVDGVAKEGQLTCGLWGWRGRDGGSGHWGPGTCPTRPPGTSSAPPLTPSLLGLPCPASSQQPCAPNPPMKLICASWALQPRSCRSSWAVRLFMVAMFTCRCSGCGT